jgi:hypothetical protein
MPSADFCSAVRPPFDSLSPLTDTEQISWGKLSRLPCTVAESTLRTLMDMDFAVSCPLVRHWRLVSGSCLSTRTFDPCFFRTPPRGGSPCIITRPSPPSGWPEDFHLQTAEHAQHTTKPLARQTLRVAVRPTRVQIWKALAQETQSGLRSPADMLITSDLSHAPAGSGYCGYQSGIQIP